MAESPLKLVIGDDKYEASQDRALYHGSSSKKLNKSKSNKLSYPGLNAEKVQKKDLPIEIIAEDTDSEI